MSAAGKILDRRGHVTVVGVGVIGLSWTALFLDHGLTVTVSDPAPDAESRVRTGLAPLVTTDGWERRLRFEADLTAAVRDADVVQENIPDRAGLKQSLWGKVEAAVSPDALLLSSSSGIPASTQAKKMKRPERLIVGHPFNPPHILPLVEVVPSKDTPAEVAHEAMDFYRAVGKHPVLIGKEIPGFIANRLQAALLRECIWIVRDGAATPAQIDEIVTTSVGPRWAANGPFESHVMGGGPGGFAHFLDHMGRGLQLLWLHSAIRPVILWPRLRSALTRQVEQGLAGTSIEQLEERRDKRLREVLKTLAGDAGSDA